MAKKGYPLESAIVLFEWLCVDEPAIKVKKADGIIVDLFLGLGDQCSVLDEEGTATILFPLKGPFYFESQRV